jgi:thymidylate synthase
MLSGKPNTDYLKAHNVKIWNANTSKEFLEKNGLTGYREGESGTAYGFQWRHWNATYLGADADYTGCGIDQIAELINKIKTDPFSRRLIVSVWNPEQLSKMCLPPCHWNFQIVCESDPNDNTGVAKYLSLFVNMRSADIALGVPFNIGFYSLLAHMLGLVCNLTPKELVICMVDCHLYANHTNGVEKQLSRTPNGFPTMRFSDRVMQKTNLNIDDFVNEFDHTDIIVENYHYYPAIEFPMAV